MHQGNLGCLGGLMDKAFNYVIENKGIDTESSYPYLAITEKQCKYNSDNIGATITSFKDIPTGSEAVRKSEVLTISRIVLSGPGCCRGQCWTSVSWY